MAGKFKQEHALETYRGMLQSASSGVKYVVVVNGGAVIALLAHLGNEAAKGGLLPNLSTSLSWFLAGIVFGGLASVSVYATNFVLFNEVVGNEIPRWLRGHMFWLIVSLTLIVAGIAFFAIGSYVGIRALSGNAVS